MTRRGVDFVWTVEDLTRIQREFTPSRPAVATAKCWEPRVDVIEDAHGFAVKAEIPGVRGDDIQIFYLRERHSLVIKGYREDGESEAGGRRFLQMEIPAGQFSREVTLPDVPIDFEGMRAQYRKGFLIVMIPKAQSVVVTGTVTITGL